MTSLEAAVSAAAALERASKQQESYSNTASLPRIGVFGNGMPETLIAAAGALPVHVSVGTTEATHPITAVIEPFVDEQVRHFLIRLMNGDFAGLAGIVFARDDAPALIAYQYASEWIRQDREREATPPLFLWNLVHTGTRPAAEFNRTQAEKLFAFLGCAGLARPDDSKLAVAAGAEAERQEALGQLQIAVGVARSGRTAAAWRNAGRFMGAAEHASLLRSALAAPADVLNTTTRIGIVGSPLASPSTYAMIEQFGTVVCDQQNFGQMWPVPGNAKASLKDILAATAADPSCFRITPTSAYRAALVKNLLAARCSLVICQLAQTDDTFGWEIPALFTELAAHNVACINLGFRDAEPDAAWLEHASLTISRALEARK
ncbi:MAG TPA: 2-hydroxyacyl-CoA dehydratase family protein [Devosia sp.]|jgi:hypothetical protein|nr:2-hydroxyacyl-CoA dehydratase family protein [Devosia sp.]